MKLNEEKGYTKIYKDIQRYTKIYKDIQRCKT
jgi:hypothetical protein